MYTVKVNVSNERNIIERSEISLLARQFIYSDTADKFSNVNNFVRKSSNEKHNDKIGEIIAANDRQVWQAILISDTSCTLRSSGVRNFARAEIKSHENAYKVEVACISIASGITARNLPSTSSAKFASSSRIRARGRHRIMEMCLAPVLILLLLSPGRVCPLFLW